jgi:hypothetical protein
VAHGVGNRPEHPSRKNKERSAHQDADAEQLLAGVVSDGQGNNLVQDLVVDPSPFDVGQQLSLFLADKVEWGQLLDSASRFGLIPQVESQVMSGHIELPSEEMTIKFQVRKGATRMEMDVAFFHALCQIASVQYNEVKQAAGESIDD